ncbi:MAG: diguanylate cyclase [Pseudomonadales bacterium]
MNINCGVRIAAPDAPRFKVLYFEAFPLQRHAVHNYLNAAIEVSFDLRVVVCTEEAEREIESGQHDLLLCDIGPTPEIGLAGLQQLRRCRRSLATIAILPVDTSNSAVMETMRNGVTEYLRQDQLNHRTLARSIRRVLNPASLSDSLFDHRSIDGVTSLANAATFGDRLRQALYRDDRYSGDVGLVLLDIDDFAAINLRYRYTTGNAILLETAYRMVDSVRKQDTVARVGDNMCAVLMESLGTLGNLQRKVFNIVQRLSQPYQVGGGETKLFSSVGAGLRSAQGQCGSHEFVDAVESALINAKRRGGNFVEYTAVSASASAIQEQAC